MERGINPHFRREERLKAAKASREDRGEKRGKHQENTKRTPREYEANTMATPESRASNALVTRQQHACNWFANRWRQAQLHTDAKFGARTFLSAAALEVNKRADSPDRRPGVAADRNVHAPAAVLGCSGWRQSFLVLAIWRCPAGIPT
jgi:hypothetical protein